MLERAAQACLRGTADAMVTAPVQKSTINAAGIPFSGHTEFLAELTQTPRVVMLLAADELRVALATTHLPLADVPAAITREDLTATLAERLAAGLVDAAILAFPYDLPGIDSVEIGDDPFWFACAPDHPLAEKKELDRNEISGCELLLLEDGHCLREHAIDACELRARDAAASFGGTSLFTLVQMAKAGLGATLLP